MDQNEMKLWFGGIKEKNNGVVYNSIMKQFEKNNILGGHFDPSVGRITVKYRLLDRSLSFKFFILTPPLFFIKSRSKLNSSNTDYWYK